MNKIIKQVIKFNKNQKEDAFVYITECFENLLCSFVGKADERYREDLTQELIFCLFVVIKKFNIRRYKIDTSLFIKDNLLELQKYEFKNINKVLNLDYISSFIDKYGKELLIKSFNSNYYRKKFIDEYILFCNENQFVSKVNKTFKFTTNKFCKAIELDRKYCVRKDHEEMINQIADESTKEKNNPLNKYKMTIDEIVFLEKFIDNNSLLSESEVAKKLGISQQAVSKRRQKIRKKYHFLRKEVN
ncbi:MAG: sigma-70 family RNA polymerase sigma factor [Bacilli bacterium]|nr:sigma-70 family RNA polymerase sigma factor [Bacilli bacterium]